MKTQQHALIVGLGIAGMAVAVALEKQGWRITIIERTNARRTYGYFIGIQKLARTQYVIWGFGTACTLVRPSSRQIRKCWRTVGRMWVGDFAGSLANPATLLRGDVEAGLWESIKDNPAIDVKFACTPASLSNNHDRTVTAVLRQNDSESEAVFDLVIGADGMRSTVRQLAFGLHEHFMQPLGAMICAFGLNDNIHNFNLRDGVMIAQPKRSLFVFCARRPHPDCVIKL